MTGLLLQPNCLFGRRQALPLGALLGVLSHEFLCIALAFGSCLLTARLGLGLTLGLLTLALNPLLTLVRLYFILEAVVLELSLGLVRVEGGFRLLTVRFRRRTICLGLGVNLRLLQAALSRQLVAA